MNIGELARVADTKAETIRYYERIGLLPPPPRTAGNYRDYSDAHFLSRGGHAISVFPSSKSGRCSISPTKGNGRARRSMS